MVNMTKKNEGKFTCAVGKGTSRQGCWKVGAEALPTFFQSPYGNFEPPFQKFITTVHPIAGPSAER